MPCPVVFISSGGIKDREIRGRNRGPKKSNTLFFFFFQIQRGYACTGGILVKHSSARAVWKKSTIFCFLGKFSSVEARGSHRSGLILHKLPPCSSFLQRLQIYFTLGDGRCSSRQSPPAISVLESGGCQNSDGLVPRSPKIKFPTEENAYFHTNSKGFMFLFVFRHCTRPSGTFSSHKCLVFLIKGFLVRCNGAASTPALPMLSRDLFMAEG